MSNFDFMRYESHQLGQVLATQAENGELALPGAENYMAKDYAIAIEAYINRLHENTIAAVADNEPGVLSGIAKFLKRHCVASRCYAEVADGRFFCDSHEELGL